MWRYLLLFCCVFAGCATPSQSNFSVDARREIASIVAMVAVSTLVDSEKHEWDDVRWCNDEPTVEEEVRSAVCHSEDVPSIDRWVTATYWPPARMLSDIGLLTMVGLPFAVSAGDTILNDEKGERFGVDSLVAGQALSATMLATALLKVAVLRPRPLTYNEEFDAATRRQGDAKLSFPSGHTSISFAAASVTAVMILERYGLTPSTGVAVTASYAGAALVGSLRMAAGKHFVTDVLAGAAIGTFFGILIPSVHLDGSPEQVLTGANRVYVPVVTVGGGF